MSTTIGTKYLNLLDYRQREAPDGGIDMIIEVLAKSNPIIGDANIMEGNLPTGHRFTQRTTEPTGSARLPNYGVAKEKSTTTQFTDTCGIYETYSQLDEVIARLNANERAFRASEDAAFIGGMNSTIATDLFYGNQGVNPEKMHGLAPRYNDTDGKYASQIITAGGAGNDNTSIWLVTWGPKTCTLIYPKGTPAGMQVNDLGKLLITDTNDLSFRAWVTQFQWTVGLALLDYRAVIRICNIDESLLTDDASSGADIMRKMLAAIYARPTQDLGDMAKTVFYCNKKIAEYLHVQSQNKSNVQLTVDNPAGKPVVNFLGIPIHICDNILWTETTVTDTPGAVLA